MTMSIGHLIVILIIVLILFGANKIPSIMKDLAKGLKIFRDELHPENKKDQNSDNLNL